MNKDNDIPQKVTQAAKQLIDRYGNNLVYIGKDKYSQRGYIFQFPNKHPMSLFILTTKDTVYNFVGLEAAELVDCYVK